MKKPLIKKKKSLISLITLFAVVLLTILSCIIFGTIQPKNNGATNIKLLNSGKMDIVMSVPMSEIPDEAKDNVEGYISTYLSAVSSQSGDNDFFKIRKVEEKDGAYEVRVSTRRMDKIKGLGLLDYGEGKAFSALSGKLKLIQEYSQGTIREQFTKVYPSITGESVQAFIQLKKGDNNISLKPLNVKTGETASYNDFSSYLEKTKDKIAMFRLLDLDFMDKITVSVNGTIKYVSSENITVIDKNTVEITPMKINATVDGAETQLDAIMGYIVFQENLSPFAIGAILVAAELLAWFITCGIVFGWFKAFFASETFRKIMRFKVVYLLMIPGLVLLIVFHYAPMFGLTTAFQDYNLLEGASSEWVGMKYFNRIFMANTDRMYRIFRNTIFISLLRIATNFPIILMFALFVNSIKNTRVKSVVQTVSFIPYFLSWAAVAGLLYTIISDYGILNTLLVKLGMERISWYAEVDSWWGILSITSLWKGMGWGTLIYISAMCNIDDELYEACALDGGGAFRKMITVTLPGIMPMICMQLILDSSSIMKDNYEQILALTNGATGLKDRLEVIGQVSFDALRSGSGFGSATAIGMIQGVIGLILVFVSNKIVKKTDNPGII